jgi:hypothetical protein
MPAQGQQRAASMRPVSRPDFSLGGISVADSELQVPEDIVGLWQAFQRLPGNKRRDFLQAGTLYQLAFDLFLNFRTASFALMVAACEAAQATRS